MRDMRLIVGDRWSGGLLAVVTALFLVGQLVAAGWASAAAAPRADDPLMVICHGLGADAASPAASPDPVDHRHDCPCGILCGAAAAAVPLLPADPGTAFALVPDAPVAWAPGAPEAGLARADGAPPFPTGPPALSA